MNRLVKNYVTTILGVLVLVYCGLMMYQEKQSASELSGWFAFGMMLLRSKDSIINLPKE